MNLQVTSAATKKIQELNQSGARFLWLYYDTVDCGCGVNGLPTIRLVKETNHTFMKVENDPFEVIVHKQQATFFAEQMKLDFNGNSFRLSSPSGILNPIIPEGDLLKGDVA
ncbi:iron-sulfur cluster biosynthesis family protein [Aquibacillus kalidii]|uniref:iron-sulfur cluster biosynthesis family protein n=1 Tax=Aquibacillus kalidii TaxID=2762597 RepID=UPI0016488C71|nr:iron-sulfur cluster biosynthesis family protein [Aquibacillus kalidii]